MPLYLFLILFGYYNFGNKGLYWIGAAIATVVLSNFISSDLIKPYFNQLRPCRETMLEPAARLMVKYCPSSGSFTSSHATNHFALAMFIFTTLKHYAKWTKWFFVWAALICYAQVYVGVHYPIDVIYGAALGSFIGYIGAKLFNIKTGLLQPKAQL
jgi:undecaprenyl-diphosphatase